MTDRQGTPIWYELVTADPDAAKTFYDAVTGWTVEARPSGPMDYRMIDTGHEGLVGGVMRLTDEMRTGGASPRWLFYLAVDDVDATAAAVTAGGGTVRMGPLDLPGVGRMAFCADPQGNPFYVMRGASDERSTAFAPTGMGRCGWNELSTPDRPAADAFYAELFGWTYPDRMTMPGDMGDYVFVAAAGQTIGATMKQPGDGSPAGWRFYFRVVDIDAAADAIRRHGGQVHAGPMEVPGGDRIVVAADAEGIPFGLVATPQEK